MLKERQLKKQIEIRDANNKFTEMIEGLKSLALVEAKMRWDNSRRFEKRIKN